MIVEDVLDAAELAACGEELRRLHQLAAELIESDAADAGHFQVEPFAEQTEAEAGPVLRKIEETYHFSELFAELPKHPKLLPVVRELLGDDLLLFRSTLMLKPARHGSTHALHQDSSYWPMDPPKLLTVSIALNEATAENGCFRIIPGSHHWEKQEWGEIATRQDEVGTNRPDVDDSQVQLVPLRAGSVIMFHSLLVHGSGPNRSDKPRNTALYAYFSPEVRYVPGPDGPRDATHRVISGLGGAKTHIFRSENPL